MALLRELLKVKPKIEGKLPVKFKAKLIDALISGKYPQTGGFLFLSKRYFDVKMGYCCLGVAGKVCEISDKVLENVTFLDYLPTSAQQRIPKLLKELALQEQLSDFNDDYNYSFKQIARWIEKYL